MKRLLLSLLLVFVLGCISTQATEPVISSLGESKYCIKTGDLSLTIDAAGGAKIRSFKYKDAEVISQSFLRESFGSTFWTSPQKEWNWPPVAEYDKLPYTVEKTSTSLVMTSQLSTKYKYRIRKEFKTDEQDHAIVITYSITNESDETRSVAPWEITRVPNEGMIFFDAPAVVPADLISLTQQYKTLWYQTDAREANRKINANGKGWLAYTTNGLLLVKKFPDLDASQAAPGESLSYTVRWYLMPANSDPTPSRQLISKVRSLIDIK